MADMMRGYGICDDLIIGDATSSPKSFSEREVTSAISLGSDIHGTAPILSSDIDITQPALLQDRQALEKMKLDFSSVKIKMEEECAAVTTALKRKYEQQLRQKELALQTVERRVEAQELEAKKKADDKEAKALKDSLAIERRTCLLSAYRSYEAAVVQAEKDLERDSLGFGRKEKIYIAKISGAHGVDQKTLQRYAISK